MVSSPFHRFLFLLPLFVVARIAIAQPKQIKFERLSIEEGLSQDQVYCIYQDSRGFMWFGTQDGLNRYDGYQFKVYRHNPENPHSLSDYAINAIVEDASGALWIGTREGLNRFDREKETFTHFRHDPGNPRSISNNQVWKAYVDRQAPGVLR